MPGIPLAGAALAELRGIACLRRSSLLPLSRRPAAIATRRFDALAVVMPA